MKKALKIVIPAVVLCVVAVVVVWFIRGKSTPLRVEEVVANLEWGMSMQEAKLALAEQGCTDYDDHGGKQIGESTVLSCVIEDYQGIEGADGELFLVFKEDKLDSGRYLFRAYPEDEIHTTVETLDELVVKFAESYEAGYQDSINEEHHSKKEPEDLDYGRYFVGEQSLVFVLREGKEQLSIRFDNLNAEGKRDLVEALKVLEATKATSPTGLYDDVQQFD